MDLTFLEYLLLVFLGVAMFFVLFYRKRLQDQKQFHKDSFDGFMQYQVDNAKMNYHRVIYDGFLNGFKLERYIFLFDWEGINVFFWFSGKVFIPDYLPSDEIVGEEREKITEWVLAQDMPKSIWEVYEQIETFNKIFPKVHKPHYREQYFKNAPLPNSIEQE